MFWGTHCTIYTTGNDWLG